MGLLARREAQGLFSGIKQDGLLQHEIAGIELRVVDVGIGAAVQKLARYVHPGERVGGEQGLGINAASADAVSLRQVGQVERLAKVRLIVVAVVESGIVGLLIVAQRSAALFQGGVKAIELQADASAVVIRLIEHAIGDGVCVHVGFESGDAGSLAGIAAIGEVR